MDHRAFERAAAAVTGCRTMVVTAGAGMGVDSGLPDFRGPQGFWREYPLYRQLGINFVDAANPVHFQQDPTFGWGFYGHRTNLYRRTVPHGGFGILIDWIANFGLCSFVVTSNVDGQFQKAGFPDEAMLEVHGSIHHLQCTIPCSRTIWESRKEIPVDLATMRSTSIPRCIRCGAVARPNILMFGDWSWVSDRSDLQQKYFEDFLGGQSGLMVVVELGAGTAIPTIRNLSERLARRFQAAVIRINPREPRIAAPHIALPCGALEGLSHIAALLCGSSTER